IGTRDDLNVAAAARVVIADLTYAQNRAISTQKLHYVRFATTAGAQNYAIRLSVGSGTDYIEDPINQTSFIRSFGTGGTRGLDLCALDAASTAFNTYDTICFDSLGQPWAVSSTDASTKTLMTTGAVKLTCGAHSLTINIEPYTAEMSIP
ncbi:MAG: hypothetical protein ACREIT_10175, partial [Tepidisphaeraceae bacterium]